MQNAALPTSFSRRRGRRRDVLTEHAGSHKDYHREENNAALHEGLNSAETFLGCKIPVKPFMNSRMVWPSTSMRTLGVLALCLTVALTLAVADIEVMKKDWRLIGRRKR